MSKRIVGIDVTRALAIVGMIIVNFTLALGQNGNPFLVDLSKLFIGKASALFVVLAGVGITLMTKNVERDIPLWKAKPYLVLTKRALFVFVLGILLSSVWIADILHFYGVYILISLFVTRWSNRQVWIGCALLVFSYPLLLMVFDYTEAWDFDSLTYNDFWTLKGFFRNLFFNGFHPVLPWMAFMWFGIWLGRFDFRDEKRIRIASRRAAFIFFSIQILAYFIPFEESINTPSSFWATFLYTPSMPPLPLYMLSGMALSTFILFSLVRLTHEHRQMRFVNSLVAMGQMALSIYILHVILGLGVIEEVGSKELGAYSIQFSFLYALGFSALMLLFSVVWKRFYHQGPFEYLMRRISSTGVK